MADTRMGSSNVFTSTAGIKFSDGTTQSTAGVLSTDVFGNSIISDATGILMTDAHGNTFQMTDGYVFFSLAGSGGGMSMFFDGTNYGTGVSDGNGNSLLLGDGFGNLNLSNESGHAGIISTSGDTCFVYGNPLFLGVASGTGLTIVPGSVTLNGPLSLLGSTPSTSSSSGIAGTITWDASYVYVCVATNTWKRSALSTW